MYESNHLQGLTILPYAHGWWIYTAPSFKELWAVIRNAIKEHGLSPTLLNILEIAKNKKYRFVRFDMEAPCVSVE
jgi:hypothetical protein